MPGKAFFIVEGGGTFNCQFNPKELKLEDTALWKASDENGKPVPLITYERGEAATLTMDLIFDTTDSSGSVQGYVNSLRAMLTATIDAGAAGGPAKRPPYVTFVWGGFSFPGVCEKISASVLMFKPDGTAVRSKVTVTLKEKAPEGTATGTGAASSGPLSAVGSMFSGGRSPARAVNVTAGQTLSQVASAAGVPMRSVATANNISDPTNLDGITQVVIPADDKMAAIIGKSAQGGPTANFAPTGGGSPFAGAGALSGALGNLTGNNPELSAAFSAAGLDSKALGLVDKGAEKAHEILDKVESKVGEKAVELAEDVGLGSQSDKITEGLGGLGDQGHDEIDGAQEAAHDYLGDPDFEAPDRE